MKKITLASLLLSASLGLQAAEDIQPFSASKAIDLTHVLHNDMVYWPGGVPFTKEVLVDYKTGGYLLHKFTTGENTGTHVDAPAHFVEGKLPIDKLTLKNLIVPMVVIDIQEQTAKNPNYVLSTADIEVWEKQHGTIPENSFVALNTGWHKKFNSPKDYINFDENKNMHFPGYSTAAAELLVKRNIAGIGIDTLSIDTGTSKDFASHIVMLKANKYQVENMAQLDNVPATGSTVIIGVLPVQSGSEAQARIIALLP